MNMNESVTQDLRNGSTSKAQSLLYQHQCPNSVRLETSSPKGNSIMAARKIILELQNNLAGKCLWTTEQHLVSATKYLSMISVYSGLMKFLMKNLSVKAPLADPLIRKSTCYLLISLATIVYSLTCHSLGKIQIFFGVDYNKK